MSWKDISRVVRRLVFVKLALKGQQRVSQLCRRFGLSRKSGYKWIKRFEREGRRGLRDRPRRPRRSPRQMSAQWVRRIRKLRRRHRTWGCRKLAARLRRLHPDHRIPAVRTIGKWLKRMKLSGRVRRGSPQGRRVCRPELTLARRSNDVWTVDFKGWFRTQDGQRVEPLTVRDLFSRYVLIVCLLPDQSWKPVRRVFMRLFGRYGYPRVIRVDNGGPFGSKGPAGLSRLSAWWSALGIRVEFIAPGHPEQNGGHEQMHRVLKAETTRPASRHLRAQQRRNDRWVSTYNEIRPHEGVEQRTPAELYRGQPVRRRTVELKYPKGWLVRQVRSNGQIKWQGRKRSIGEAFIGYPVGLKALGVDTWEVYFGDLVIGQLLEKDSGGIRPTRYCRRG